MARKSKGKKNATTSNKENPQPKTEGVSNFSNIVSQSKERIAGVTVDTSKRRVGRPRKEENQNQNPIPETPRENPVQNNERVEAVEKVDITPYLVLPLKVASLYPANRTEIPELALTDEEALACAQSIQAILDVYTPDIAQADPKQAALIQAFTTFGAIGFGKYMIYLQKKPTMKKPEKKPEVKTDDEIRVTPDQVFQTQAVAPRPS